MSGVRFGYLTEPTMFTWSAGSVKPLPEYQDVVANLAAHPRVYGDWCYPPLAPVRHINSETKAAPEVESEFSLPCTHVLALHDPTLIDCDSFFIALLGFLKGRRLQQEGWQHLYKTPIKGELCDFVARDKAIIKTFDVATEFIRHHTEPKVRKLTFGALHWHLFAQLYEHQFERFNAQYMALDACFRLARVTGVACPPRLPHAERTQHLCHAFGLDVPVWAIVALDAKSCPLSARRNNLAHEAMYGGEPIGFTHPQDHPAMDMELTNLVARLFLRLLGVDNQYTRSSVSTRQMMLFD